MMIKPPDFWSKVARDVAAQAHAMNPEIPTWDEMSETAQQSFVVICQLAVKCTARHGRAELPYEPEVA